MIGVFSFVLLFEKFDDSFKFEPFLVSIKHLTETNFPKPSLFKILKVLKNLLKKIFAFYNVDDILFVSLKRCFKEEEKIALKKIRWGKRLTFQYLDQLKYFYFRKNTQFLQKKLINPLRSVAFYLFNNFFSDFLVTYRLPTTYGEILIEKIQLENKSNMCFFKETNQKNYFEVIHMIKRLLFKLLPTDFSTLFPCLLDSGVKRMCKFLLFFLIRIKFFPYNSSKISMNIKNVLLRCNNKTKITLSESEIFSEVKELKSKYRSRMNCSLILLSSLHGRGVVNINYILGSFSFCQYSGDILDFSISNRIEKLYQKHDFDLFIFKKTENCLIDATYHGFHSRYINHSCEPNCFSEYFTHAGRDYIFIISFSKVSNFIELVYNYNIGWNDISEQPSTCCCFSLFCNDYIDM